MRATGKAKRIAKMGMALCEATMVRARNDGNNKVLVVDIPFASSCAGKLRVGVVKKE